MRINNINQGALLVVEADGPLIINLNASPPCGEVNFPRRLIRRYPRKRAHHLALCPVNADMFSLIDEACRALDWTSVRAQAR